MECRKQNPSFSSNLLDVIYRSIDETDADNPVVYNYNKGNKSVRNRQSIDACYRVDNNDDDDDNDNDKQIADRAPISGDSRKSATGFEIESSSRHKHYGNGNRLQVSSSEAETLYGFRTRPKAIRTIIHEDDESNKQQTRSSIYPQRYRFDHDSQQSTANCEATFVKKKSRATRIYDYLKKSKQPISPGGRLATFVISLFTTANTKKSKIPSPYSNDEAVVYTSNTNRKSKLAPIASTSSSTSPFSRSCLSKTPPSSSTAVKRSVTFYPMSVILDEHSKPVGYKSLNLDRYHRSDSHAVKSVQNSNYSINEKVEKHISKPVGYKSLNIDSYHRSDSHAVKSVQNSNYSINEKVEKHVEESRKSKLKNYYQNKVENAIDSIIDDETNNDDDEGASDGSSDLFELDHLRCMQELPLYETTSVHVNQAIANGLLV